VIELLSRYIEQLDAESVFCNYSKENILMIKRGESKPILFEITLIAGAFVVAGVITAAGSLFNIHPSLTTSVARVFVGVVLLIIYRNVLKGGSVFNNLVIVLPALLFVVWNLYYNLAGGAQFGGMAFYVEAVVIAIAPAIFEEVIFRGIFIHNMRASGYSDMKCLWISAAFFSLVHLTNLVGQPPLIIGLQVIYAFSVGLVLGAIYIRNGSLLQVMIIHFLIDFFSNIFMDAPTSASWTQIGIFAALLICEGIYGVWLVARNRGDKLH
jgi:membrane protease YdiL (CAAX protease family)